MSNERSFKIYETECKHSNEYHEDKLWTQWKRELGRLFGVLRRVSNLTAWNFFISHEIFIEKRSENEKKKKLWNPVRDLMNQHTFRIWFSYHICTKRTHSFHLYVFKDLTKIHHSNFMFPASSLLSVQCCRVRGGGCEMKEIMTTPGFTDFRP
jgi:hypothetical protein